MPVQMKIDSYLRDVLAGWRRSVEGVAAIEFAFIAPVMLVMFFGTLEAARAYSVHRRFMNAANMVGDLVARADKPMTDGELKEIYKLIPQAMAQYPSDNVKFRLQVIPIIPHPSNTNVGLVYSAPANRPSYGTMPSYNKCASVGLSTVQGVALKGKTAKGMILLRAEYKFAPLFATQAWVQFGTPTWKMETMLVPRYGCIFGSKMDATGCNITC